MWVLSNLPLVSIVLQNIVKPATRARKLIQRKLHTMIAFVFFYLFEMKGLESFEIETLVEKLFFKTWNNNRLFQTFHTLMLQRINCNLFSFSQHILPLNQFEDKEEIDQTMDFMTDNDKSFCELFNLPHSENPLQGIVFLFSSFLFLFILFCFFCPLAFLKFN